MCLRKLLENKEQCQKMQKFDCQNIRNDGLGSNAIQQEDRVKRGDIDRFTIPSSLMVVEPF
jgi:hypothetical protein